jgi:hypothetical protein
MLVVSAGLTGADLVVEGSPLRVMSFVSRKPPTVEDEAKDVLSLVARPVTGVTSVLPMTVLRVEASPQPPGSLVIIAHEIEAVSLRPGAYQMAWNIGGSELELPESVWVVDKETHAAIWGERTDEDFADEPVLWTMDDVQEMLGALDYHGLSDPRVIGGASKPLLRSASGFPSSSVAASPLRWFAQGLLDIFALFLANLSSMRWDVEISRRTVQITLSSSIWLPVSRRMREMVLDRTHGIASLLNRDGLTQGFRLELQAEDGATDLTCLVAYRHDVRGGTPVTPTGAPIENVGGQEVEVGV